MRKSANIIDKYSGVNVLSATVSEEAGRWFVSVQVEEEVPDPPAGTSEPIGVDVGINRLAQCSDGRVVENPKALPPGYQEQAERESLPRVICDYIAGMTDNYIISQHENHCG